MMKTNFSDTEIQLAHSGSILTLLEQGADAFALRELAMLRDDLYAAIPARQRIGRWVTRDCRMWVGACALWV
jgi:hypothetical protein